MKIAAPLNRFHEIEGLIKAGADELYCGLIDRTQWQAYASSACLNRRENLFSNLNSQKELKQAARITGENGIPLILALNEFYNQDQLISALRQVEEALSCGVDTFLVSDLGLISALRGKFKGIKLYLSSCATVFNSQAIKLYAGLGVTRIVLHRHLSIKEIASLKSLIPGGLAIEAFVLNEKCFNLDGFCSFQHGNTGNKGGLNFSQIPFLIWAARKYVGFFPKNILQFINNYLVSKSHPCCYTFRERGSSAGKITFNTADHFLYACGLCNIYDFYKLGVSHIKIAGRSILTDQIKNIRLVKEITGLLDGQIQREDFVKIARNIAGSAKKCRPLHCFYSAG